MLTTHPHPLTEIARAGYEARRRGDMRAPGGNALIQSLIATTPIGDTRTLAVMREWNHGWLVNEAEELRDLGFPAELLPDLNP